MRHQPAVRHARLACRVVALPGLSATRPRGVHCPPGGPVAGSQREADEAGRVDRRSRAGDGAEELLRLRAPVSNDCSAVPRRERTRTASRPSAVRGILTVTAGPDRMCLRPGAKRRSTSRSSAVAAGNDPSRSWPARLRPHAGAPRSLRHGRHPVACAEVCANSGAGPVGIDPERR